jgi:hypothetical protein
LRPVVVSDDLSLNVDGRSYMSSYQPSVQDCPTLRQLPQILLFDVYFSDKTVLSIGYTKQDQLVSIQYGTWAGLLRLNGWLEVSSFDPESDWPAADGHLEYGALRLFEIVTSSS